MKEHGFVGGWAKLVVNGIHRHAKVSLITPLEVESLHDFSEKSTGALHILIPATKTELPAGSDQPRPIQACSTAAIAENRASTGAEYN